MVTIERDIEKAILDHKRWADLDNRMRDLIGSSQEYDKKILRYSIENQLRYRGNLVRFVVNDEYQYYIQLLKYSREHLMLFPYHLSDFVITGMRITPFQYYLLTMSQIIEQEKSYDTLPNFTAADCLRLLGVGRNQYIDIMNELRSTYRKYFGIGLRKSARSLLPTKPDKNVCIEPWWFINAGYITEDDVRSMVSPAERSIIDKLVSPDGLSNQILACDLDESLVRSLYLKGLIYLDVPIYDDDYIVVPPLEGFVMNRVTGDYFETLLYKIFVSIDQSTSVQELANILEIDIKLVKNAVSMYCRLRFAYKKNIYIDSKKCHPSWRSKLDSYSKLGINLCSSRDVSDFIKELALAENNDTGTEVTDISTPSIKSSHDLNSLVQNKLTSPISSSLLSPTTSTNQKKIVFFYDSNLAAFLMMGNLSTKLKTHAVTMFEVGKLSDEWIDSLLNELNKINSETIDEDGYEAKRYYIHALMLHRTIEFIRSHLRLDDATSSIDNSTSQNQKVSLDLVRVESLSNLHSSTCERFLKKNYKLIISVAPLNQDVKLDAAASLPHFGPGSPLINSLWFRLYIYHVTSCGPPSLLLLQGFILETLPEAFNDYETLIINHWAREPTCISARSPNALNLINDALTHCPILVQAYPVQPIGGNLTNGKEKVFVALPLKEDSRVDSSGLEDCHENEEQPEDLDLNCSLEQKLPVTKLAQCLDLKRVCGYITLLRSTKAMEKVTDESVNTVHHRSQSSSDSPPPNLEAKETSENKFDSKIDADVESIQQNDVEADEELTLFDCHFGIPLFDRFLNKQVRTRMLERNLCGSSSLEELVITTKDLNSKLEAFVEEFSANKNRRIDTTNAGDQRHFFNIPDTEQFRSVIPRPAQNLIFVDGKLSVFEEAAD